MDLFFTVFLKFDFFFNFTSFACRALDRSTSSFCGPAASACTGALSWDNVSHSPAPLMAAANGPACR